MRLAVTVFALGLRQFALSERKSNLANNIAISFRQLAKLYFLVETHRIIGQAAMYLVSLESSLKMQENCGHFIMIPRILFKLCKFHICVANI